MSAVVEDFNLLEEFEFTSDSTHTYLDNDEFDTDAFGVAENEGSDTDAGYSTFDNTSSKDEETERRNARYERGIEEGSEDSDGESEITFLRLKVKLLMKESNEQYNELMGRFAASEETVKTLVKINHCNREEQELDSNRWSPRSRDAQQARGLISPQLSELTNSLANLKWGFKKRENELLSQLDQYKKVTVRLQGSQKRLRSSLRSVCERICDGLVTAEQAVEATEEMNKDTLSEKESLHGDLQKLQVIELKKRIKTLEAKNSELTEMTQNFLEVENEVKEQLQKRQEGYERQKEELKDMQQQIKDDIHQQREKEESNNEERKIREEEIVHLRSEVDVLKSSLIDSFDDREEAEQVIYKLNVYTTLLEDRIMKLDDYVNEIESQKQKETVEDKLNERASDKKIVKILEDSKEAVHGDEGSVHRSLPVEFLQLEEECGRTATVNQERSVRPRFLIDNRNTDGDEGESDGSVNSYEETILAANMVEDEDGYKDEEEEERKRYLLSRALGIEHRISVAAHLDAVNEQIIERRAFKGGVEPKTERGSYSLHSNGRAHSPNAIRSPQRRASPERIENIKYTADVHIEGINNSIGHDINGTRLNNGNSSSCIIPDTNEGQIGPHNNSNYVDRSVRRSDDKAVERVGMCSLNSASHLSVESKGSRIEGSLTNSIGNIKHGDYFIVSNPSIFDEKSMGKVALKAQNTGTFPSGEANIASLLRMQYGHLLNTPLSVIPSKNITGEMGAENWSKNSADRGGRSEKYSGQRESDIIKRQLQDHYKSFENLSSELRTENPRSNISYPVLTNNSNTGLIRNIFGTTSTVGNLSLTSVLTGPTHPPSLSDSGSAGGLASSTSSSSSSSIVCPFERLKFQLRSQLECISSMGQRESHYSQSNGQQQQQQEQHLEQDNMQNCDRSILSHKIGTGETDTVAAVTTVNRDVKSVREELIACLLSSR